MDRKPGGVHCASRITRHCCHGSMVRLSRRYLNRQEVIQWYTQWHRHVLTGHRIDEVTMMMWYTKVLITIAIVLVLGSASLAQTDEAQSQTAPAEATRTQTQLAVFDEIWHIVREHFYDPTLRHLDWATVG